MLPGLRREGEVRGAPVPGGCGQRTVACGHRRNGLGSVPHAGTWLAIALSGASPRSGEDGRRARGPCQHPALSRVGMLLGTTPACPSVPVAAVELLGRSGARSPRGVPSGSRFAVC